MSTRILSGLRALFPRRPRVCLLGSCATTMALSLIGTAVPRLHAQGAATVGAAARPAAVQPRIMVIPRVKEGEDLRTMLDADVFTRIGIAKVKEAFDRRGFSTVDFVARLKAADENGLFTEGSQTGVRDQLIQMSGADIYVEVELRTTTSPQGNGCTVILGAYEASTGTSLANKVGSSGRFYGASEEQLVQRAVEGSADDLLGTMQAKFTAMLDEGRAILVDISLRQGARSSFSALPKGQEITLGELLEQWMTDHAFRNAAHLQGTTAMRMVFDDVRLPLRDERTGRSYATSQFGSQLATYLRTLGYAVTRDVKGATLYLVITGP